MLVIDTLCRSTAAMSDLLGGNLLLTIYADTDGGVSYLYSNITYWHCTDVCHHLGHMRSRNVYDLNLSLSNGLRSNVNKSIERPFSNSYLVKFTILYHLRDIRRTVIGQQFDCK